MKIDFKGIMEGVWNSLFVKESVEAVHRERLKMCLSCQYNSSEMKKVGEYKTFRPDFHCTVCGCNLDMKTRCMSCECPPEVGKWRAIMTEEEENKLTEKLKENGDSNSK